MKGFVLLKGWLSVIVEPFTFKEVNGLEWFVWTAVLDDKTRIGEI